MTQKKDHRISLEQAIDMTTRFRANKPAGVANSETFDKAAVLQLLNTKNCESLTIYYGMREDQNVHAILVAADANGKSILPTIGGNLNQNESEEDEDEVLILDDAWRCPPICNDDGSPLNGG